MTSVGAYFMVEDDPTSPNYLEHYGTPHEPDGTPHSGCYPYGSGEDAYQRYKDFQAEIREMESKNFSETDIAAYYHIKTGELRARRSFAKKQIRAAEVSRALRLRDEGHSTSEIARRMGKNESSIRELLKPAYQMRIAEQNVVADTLRKAVEEHKYVDVGPGIDTYLNATRDNMKKTLAALKGDGYKVQYFKVEQAGTGKNTSVAVLTKEDTPWKEMYEHRDQIYIPEYRGERGPKGELDIYKVEPPRAVDSSRLEVKYVEDGGADKDGVIELRRGVDDISLGNAHYAQARIRVHDSEDPTKPDRYLKGMCVYADDLPDGIDIRFNSNKHKDAKLEDGALRALKKFDGDPDDPKNTNPFGATIQTRDDQLILAQRHYTDENGNKQLSCINIVNEEGDWDTWAKTLSSQFLSKQRPDLIKRQLDITYDNKLAEFNDIKEITNNAVKKEFLMSFAEDCDASAVHLKAAGLPRQSSHVILPLTTIESDRCYATGYPNGTKLALIRFPHGTIGEIPVVTVDNNNQEARRVLGNARDAIGIHHSVAEQLSGADFDGDTVLAIPLRSDMTTSKDLSSSSPLLKLRKFNPSEAYPAYEGMKVMSERTKQLKMGDISNLITDMTIMGANDDEIARAIKHSMVVIDAVKHELNWKQSYKDNGIAALKKKYQGGENKGAATLISKASSEKRVDHYSDRVTIDPETGALIREKDGATYKKLQYQNLKDERGRLIRDDNGKPIKVPKLDENGNKVYKDVPKTTKTTKMADESDAMNLSSGSYRESLYGNYANNLKALANAARLEWLNTPNTEYNPSAAKQYSEEVKRLAADLRLAESNAPLERKAQTLAEIRVKSKISDNPDMTSDEIKKERGRAITEARDIVGAKKIKIDIDDKEWEAIQAGAVSNHTIERILKSSDKDKLRERAMPRSSNGMSEYKTNQAAYLLRMGYDFNEVADQLDVSVATLKRAVPPGAIVDNNNT